MWKLVLVVAAIWLTVSGGGFVLHLRWLSNHHQLDGGSVLAAMQAWAQIAGGGATVAALVGVVRGLQPQRAGLRLVVLEVFAPHHVKLAVENHGSVAAEGAEIVFEGAEPGQIQALEGTERWQTLNAESPPRLRYDMDQRIPPHGGRVPIGTVTYPPGTTRLTAQCFNGRPDSWEPPWDT